MGGGLSAPVADVGRLSPLLLGRWWPAVTLTLGTALADQRGWPVLRAAIVSPRKDHSHGRSLRSRLRRRTNRAALDSDLPRQNPAPIGRTGQSEADTNLPMDSVIPKVGIG